MSLWLMPAFSVLGMAVGSFLNLCIDRLPAGQSIVTPSSHCPACNQRLGVRDLVPLGSYLWLRGRCRYCHALIPLRLPIVELATGIIFALLYLKFGPGLELATALIYASLLLVIFVIDLEHQLVLDKVVFPGMALVFAFSFFRPEPGTMSAVEGSALGLGGMALPFLVSRGGIGLGDVKLGGLLGLITGFPLVAVALLLAVMAGGLVSVLLLIFGFKKRGDPIPFAPFLASSTMVTLLWGQQIWDWYLH